LIRKTNEDLARKKEKLAREPTAKPRTSKEKNPLANA